MEVQKISEKSAQRLSYFMAGLDSDGFEISDLFSLENAYTLLSMSLHRDLGFDAGLFLKDNVKAQFVAIARKLLNDLEK